VFSWSTGIACGLADPSPGTLERVDHSQGGEAIVIDDIRDFGPFFLKFGSGVTSD
jgi:hypothetical protein